MDRFHDFHRGITGLWNLFGRDAPYFRRVCASLGIADRTLTRKLFTFLSVLASTLPVALPGDHGAPCTFAPDISGREAQVDQRETILDPLRLVLDTARVQSDRSFGVGKKVRRAFDRLWRD